jgi:hypothetical protein
MNKKVGFNVSTPIWGGSRLRTAKLPFSESNQIFTGVAFKGESRYFIVKKPKPCNKAASAIYFIQKIEVKWRKFLYFGY